MASLRSDIFKTLKSFEELCLTEEALLRKMIANYSAEIVQAELKVLVQKGLLKTVTLPDGSTGYAPKFVLDAPLKRKMASEFYQLDKVQKLVPQTALPTDIPQEWINPFIKAGQVAWRDQKDRGTCFPDTMMVKMSDQSYQSIKNVKAGDLVISHTGQPRKVLKVMQRSYNGDLYFIKVDHIPSVIVCTPEHPFLTGRGWVNAKDLTQKDQLATASPANVYTIIYRAIFSIVTDRNTFDKVYNLEVEEDQSYIVYGVIVHNCVGQSTAYGRDLDLLRLTNDMPTAAEKNQVQKDIDSDGLIHDQLFDNHSFSAECAYQYSRTEGHCTFPSGSYVDASVKSLVKRGCCMEREWYTAKTPYCTAPNGFPYIENDVAKTEAYLAGKAAQHKTDGFVTVTGIDRIKAAIYKYGYVYMPIDIFDNYTQSGCEGNFPDPAGSPAGAHALCWVGYDVNNLICVHSWGQDWSYLGGISNRYYQRAYDSAPGVAFAVLDSTETKDVINIIQKQYCKITITANTMCNISVNGDAKLCTNVSVQVEKGQPITIRATPTIPTKWNEPYLERTYTPSTDTDSIIFTFTAVKKKKRNFKDL